MIAFLSLFWKASGFDENELTYEKIKETVRANAHLIKDFNEKEMEEEIAYLLSTSFLFS